mgnify:CR=1 FL=1
MDTLKLSGNMVSISTRPEDAGHAEFARDCLAENRQLKAINAELLDALKNLIGYAAAEIGIPPNEAVGGAFKKARAAIAKAEGK